jgi:hypothetical protein
MKRVVGWEAYEKIGIGIPNPRAVTRIPIPPGLTKEQLDAIERAIDILNAEQEALEAAEEPPPW